MCLDKNMDALNILRKISEQKRRTVMYRDRRPHLFAEDVEYVPDSEGIEKIKGCVFELI